MKYKNYMVSWQGNGDVDYYRLFKIQQTVNRPNNPEDEEIICDYMEVNYGRTVNNGISVDYLEETIVIGENYAVET